MSSYSFQGRKRVWKQRDEDENRAIFSTMPYDTGIKMPNEFKPVYLENEEYVVEKWNVKQLIRLLRLYGSHRCLWDVRDPDNRNRKLRKAAMIDITAAMGSNITMEQVLQKINVLRGTYRYEKRRIKMRIRRGLGASTKLKWFALADAFLRNVPRAEKFRKPEDVDIDSELEDDVVFTINPELLLPLDDSSSSGTLNLTAPDDNEQNVATVNDNVTATNTFDSICNENSNSSDMNYAASPRSSSKESLPLISANLNFSTPEIVVPLTAKRHWGTKESMQFVALLGAQPTLWPNNFMHEPQLFLEQYDAMLEIANKMEMPLKRIEKRVQIFNETYAAEKSKIMLNPNYKSNLVWFSLAESLLESKFNLEHPNFIDPNLLPPPTPLSDTNVVIKKEDNEDDSTYAPINPIASVQPPSAVNEMVNLESLELLLNDENTTTIKNELSENIESNDNISSHSPPPANSLDSSLPSSPSQTQQTNNSLTSSTKLIWNGLEDDLLEGKWSLKHSVKFLRLYGSHRCLWDLNDPDYRSRELRNAAIEDIAAAMGYGLNADYVAKKIKIFRITYMQQRKRMLELLKEGKQESEIQLRWFPLADSFLRPHIGLRSIKDNEREVPQFDFQYVYANLNLIDPALLNDFVGKGTQNSINIGAVENAELQTVDFEQNSNSA